MKPIARPYVTPGFDGGAQDSRRVNSTFRDIVHGLDRRLTLDNNLDTEFLSVEFRAPQTTPLRIKSKYTSRPQWVELISFSKTLPIFAPLSLGTVFRWQWDNGYISTDVFVGMPTDSNLYTVQLRAFLQ